MELRHFRHFVAVAEKDTSRAPPSGSACSSRRSSQRIKAIESELDVRAPAPKGARRRADRGGADFLEQPARSSRSTIGAFETTRRAARGEQGSLCVGVMPTAPFHPLVPLVIRSFRAAFPLVSLTLDECLSGRGHRTDCQRPDGCRVFRATSLTRRISPSDHC